MAKIDKRARHTRGVVIGVLSGADRPLSTTEISQLSGSHKNTVRVHLQELLQQQRVRRSAVAPSGRGRPADEWELRTGAVEDVRNGMVAALAQALAQGGTDPLAAARAAGQAWGSQIATEWLDDATPMGQGKGQGADRGAGRSASLAAQRVFEAISDQGFSPNQTPTGMALHRCPLMTGKAPLPTTVCAVHQGMVESLIRSSAPAAADADVRVIPGAAGPSCLVEVAL